MRRALLLTAVVVCAASLLTGCGPRVSSGVVGMSVDDDSDTPVIVLQNCHGDIAQLEFYDRTRPRMEETVPATVVMYVNPRPAKAVVEIPILTGGDGWEVDRAVPALRADGKYVIEAWGKRHEWSGHGTEFTLADLKGLKPGQVRHNSRPGGATPPYDATTTEYKTTPMAEFITDECP